jgi:ribosome-associated protein
LVSKTLRQTIEGCEREVELEFVRASGPGGQNVNKVATAAQLRFDLRRTQLLDPQTKERLVKIAGARISPRGVLLIQASRHRTQAQNRADALARFDALLERAMTRPKARRATKPSAASHERRLHSKKIRGQIKRTRRSGTDE